MSDSHIPEDPERYNKEVTVIYSDDSMDVDDPRYKPREKMKLGDALSKIDNSKQYSFCVCGHDIDQHAPVEDYKSRYAGVCRYKDCSCSQYYFSGLVRTAKEIEESGKNPSIDDGTNTHPAN